MMSLICFQKVDQKFKQLTPSILLVVVIAVGTLYISSTSYILSCQAKELVIVESKRPFIDFDIKHLNFNIESRKRAFEEVKDFALGASYVHQSLFSNKKRIRCSAYGQLFKLIASNKTLSIKKPKIRLSTVQELTVVVQKNWPYYYKLLNDNSSEYVNYFKSAATSLLYSKNAPNFSNSRDVVLDLINCINDIVATKDNQQDDTSDMKKLIEDINLWLMFKSEPILSKKSQLMRKQTFKEIRDVESFYQEAMKSIGLYDQNVANYNLYRSKINATTNLDSLDLKPNGTLIESHEPLGVWLHLDKPASEAEAELKFPVFHREQLKVMNFVKFRLIDMKNGRNFPVDVELAIDFQTHWQALKKYIKTFKEPNKLALDFYHDKTNSKLAKTIDHNLKLYHRFSLVFNRLSRKNFKFPSMKDYCNAIRKTKESLNKINQYDLIDIDDIYRVFDFWYSTHKQTCDVYWPAKNKIFDIPRRKTDN